MSSGNYQEYRPETWFDFNRNEIIDAFHKKPKVKKRAALIKKLEKQVAELEAQESREWDKFRNKCIKEESY